MDKLEKRLGGNTSLMITPHTKLNAPILKHIKFSLIVNGTTLTALPPNYTIEHCTTNVSMAINKNILLLKNPLKTLYSFAPNFLALI
jgi:hypothetical protein